MSEFLDYKVALQLKNGASIQGFVTHVNSAQIGLGNQIIENSKVKDVRVISLPMKTKQKSGTIPAMSSVDDSICSFQEQSVKSGTSKQSSKNPDWSSNVQDIKSSEEFDFAANLAMFDKKSVFADFQKNDNVNAQDRLVSHNKVERITQDGSEKYDNDEMVLKDRKDNWNKIGSLSQRYSSPLSAKSLALNNHKPSRDSQVFKFAFPDGSYPVPLASPVQLLEIERIAMESFGVESIVSAEICASNLYNLVVSNILGGSVRLSNRKNHNLPPLVLLLIGSGHCSSKAFALGRHLSNHGVRVLAYVLNEDIVEEDTLRQWHLFEKSGGKVVGSNLANLLDILDNQLDTPVELVVDSLQGFASQLSDIFYTSESMEKLKEVICWVNEPGQKFKVLSLDISSGIDGGSGTVFKESLKVNSHLIVSLGLPISGLLHAYNNGSLNDDTLHFMVDLGIPNDVYSVKPHLRKFDKFWFCAEGFTELKVIAE